MDLIFAGFVEGKSWTFSGNYRQWTFEVRSALHAPPETGEIAPEYRESSETDHRLSCTEAWSIIEHAKHRYIASVSGTPAPPAKATAQWTITIHYTCPHCARIVDLLDHLTDLLTEIQVGEWGTQATTDIEATCPHCAHDILVSLEY
jgi:DNA-directed RNA polymerase subunit RPC12/RpoP